MEVIQTTAKRLRARLSRLVWRNITRVYPTNSDNHGAMSPTELRAVWKNSITVRTARNEHYGVRSRNCSIDVAPIREQIVVGTFKRAVDVKYSCDNNIYRGLRKSPFKQSEVFQDIVLSNRWQHRHTQTNSSARAHTHAHTHVRKHTHIQNYADERTKQTSACILQLKL